VAEPASKTGLTARVSEIRRIPACRHAASELMTESGAPLHRQVDSVRIGFAGVGRMGLPMCANLVRAGYDVVAGDACADREDAVSACGARWGGTGAEVAAVAEVLITVLPGTKELHDLMLGPGGALAALPAPATWIDMTSTSPRVGKMLAGAALGRGIGMLEAPVGGGVPAAEAGTLQLFVGGDAALLERHRNLLQALADPERIAYLGGPGAGYTAKHLVNLLWFGQALATAEALLLAHREGIDLETLRHAMAGSAAASSFISHDLGALLSGDYLASFGLDRCCEELAAITELARQDGVPFGISEHVERTYQRALARYGPADGEFLAVALLEEQAGTRLRRHTP
jgi:3-hydroxyisobutyrate dehydrogenase